MPKTNIDYSKVVLYKIVCKDLNITDCYVGHTTNFRRRKFQHKSSSSNEKNNLKVYEMIRLNGNWENWEMIEIEKYPCSDANEAGARERYWYEFLHANLNCNKPNRTGREYRDDHKEQRKVNQKGYREANKDKIKKYYEDNKDKINEYNIKYYEDNKQILLKTNSCECGGKYITQKKARHMKSKVHQNYVKQNITEI